jgi:asparagine synthetase B (glutamine-hydrolysing)
MWNIVHRKRKDLKLVNDLPKGCRTEGLISLLAPIEKGNILSRSERLSIIDLSSGKQPIQGNQGCLDS